MIAHRQPLSTHMELYQNFREAAEAHGKYFPDRNELHVRKDGRIYRFICGDCEIRFTAPKRPEIVLPIAPDATVRELGRCIACLSGESE